MMNLKQYFPLLILFTLLTLIGYFWSVPSNITPNENQIAVNSTLLLKKHEEHRRTSPFMSSSADFDFLDCSFFLTYNQSEAYKSCNKSLHYAKESIRLSNSEDWTKKFSTCAVVGSGAQLLDTRYGHDITAHEKVFRFNDAPTIGFEEHVGSRTDFRVMNYASIVHDTAHEEEGSRRVFSFHIGIGDSFIIISYFFTATDLIFHPTELMDLAFLVHPFNQSDFERSMVGKTIHKSVATSYCSPSTGLRGVYLALKLCEKVTIYGFSEQYDKSQGWSYYAGEKIQCPNCWNATASTSKSHCFPAERKLRNDWINNALELFGSQLTVMT